MRSYFADCEFFENEEDSRSIADGVKRSRYTVTKFDNYLLSNSFSFVVTNHFIFTKNASGDINVTLFLIDDRFPGRSTYSTHIPALSQVRKIRPPLFIRFLSLPLSVHYLPSPSRIEDYIILIHILFFEVPTSLRSQVTEEVILNCTYLDALLSTLYLEPEVE